MNRRAQRQTTTRYRATSGEQNGKGHDSDMHSLAEGQRTPIMRKNSQSFCSMGGTCVLNRVTLYNKQLDDERHRLLGKNIPVTTFHQVSSVVKRLPVTSSDSSGVAHPDIPYTELSSTSSPRNDGNRIVSDIRREPADFELRKESPLSCRCIQTHPEVSLHHDALERSHEDRVEPRHLFTRRPSLPLSDRHFLNPFQKWVVYHRFPFKFVIHLTLAILVATQMFVFSYQETAHLRITLKNLHLIFFEDDFASSIQRKISFHSPAAFESALTQSIDRYFTLNDHTVNIYFTLNPYDAPLYVLFKNGSDYSFVFHRDFASNPTFEALLRSVRSIQRVVLLVGLKDIYSGPLWTSCFYIQTEPTFDYSKGGLIEAWLGWTVAECDEWIGKLSFGFLALHCSAIILCLFSMVLLIRSIARSFRDLRRVKRTVASDKPSWTNYTACGPLIDNSGKDIGTIKNGGRRRSVSSLPCTSHSRNGSLSPSRAPSSIRLSILSSPNIHSALESPPSQNKEYQKNLTGLSCPASHNSGREDIKTEAAGLPVSSSFPALGEVPYLAKAQRYNRNGASRRGLTRVKTSAFNLNNHLPDSGKFDEARVHQLRSAEQFTYTPSLTLPATTQEPLAFGSSVFPSKHESLLPNTERPRMESGGTTRSYVRSPRILNTSSPTESSRTSRGRTTPKMGNPDWNSLNASEKFQFFNWWSVVSLLANSMHLVASLWCFIPHCDVSNRLFSLGLACFLTWINLLRYLEYSPSLYILVRTLRRGLPKLAEFLVSVIPLFFGFCALGMCMFWPLNDFSSLTDSSKTLFSVLNGDEIHNTFGKISPLYPFLSQIYLYAFTCIFMYVILNVFISIIDEAFFSEQLRSDLFSKDRKDINSSDGEDRLSFCPACHFALNHEVPRSNKNDNTLRNSRGGHLTNSYATDVKKAEKTTHERLLRCDRRERRFPSSVFGDQPRYENSADGSLTVWQPEVRDDHSMELGEYDDVDALGIRLVQGPFADFIDEELSVDNVGVEEFKSKRSECKKVSPNASSSVHEDSPVIDSSSPSVVSHSASVISSHLPNSDHRRDDAFHPIPRPEPHPSWLANLQHHTGARQSSRRPPRTKMQRSHTCHTSFGTLQLSAVTEDNRLQRQQHNSLLNRAKDRFKDQRDGRKSSTSLGQHNNKTENKSSQDGSFPHFHYSPRVQALIQYADQKLSSPTSDAKTVPPDVQ